MHLPLHPKVSILVRQMNKMLTQYFQYSVLKFYIRNNDTKFR